MKIPAIPCRPGMGAAFWDALLSRSALLVTAASAIVVAAALNWGWLVTIGLAPLLLSALPCALTCAFGLCMKGRGESCEKPTHYCRPMTGESSG